MGNSPSVQQPKGERGVSGSSQEHNSNRGGHYQAKYLMEMDKGRQNSITSQLFPSRKGRHAPAGLGNIMRKTQHAVPHAPSLFKKNYSLEGASAGAEGSSEATSEAPSAGARTPSAESVRANMAGLSLKISNDVGGPTANPYLLSPGPATPTVQPTKEEAIPIEDTELQKLSDHRPSVVALKRNLEGNEQLSSASSSNFGTRSNSIDIRGVKGNSSQNHHATIRRNSVDTDFDSSDAENMSDDGYLQSKDVVLNQSLVHNILKRDMKRKRGKETSRSNSANDVHAAVPASKDGTLEPGDRDIRHQTTLKSEQPRGRNGLSYESITSSHLPEIKKLKPISHDILLPHATSEHPKGPSEVKLKKHFYSMDSFEKGSVEHREVEDQNNKSFASSSGSSSAAASRTSQDVRVIIKWRDPVPESSHNRVSMISEDIASTLSFERQKQGAQNTFAMEFDPKSKEWFVPDLLLPAGIYRLQFLVNGEIRHSNYLPTATDSVGNFVNWFEVVPGYAEVEPYREEVEIDSKPLAQEEVSTSSTSDNQGTALVQPIPGKAERPPLAPMQHSSNRVLRSNTPHSDFTGVSRSSSALRKSPLMQYNSSSLDLVTALQPKKYKYSNEIPELFKTTPLTTPEEENKDVAAGHIDQPFPPSYGWHHYQKMGLDNRVVDCNQDELFTHLQQGGILDAETAEQLFLDKFPVPDLPVYLNSYYLNKILNEFQKNNYNSSGSSGINHIIPHVNLNHLLTSSIRDEMISVGCTTRYEGKFITQVIYSPCYYERGGAS